MDVKESDILEVDLYSLIWLLMAFSAKNPAQLEAHLEKNATLTEGGNPGPLDAAVALEFKGTPLFSQNRQMPTNSPICIVGTLSSELSLLLFCRSGQPSTSQPKPKRRRMTISTPSLMMTMNPLSLRPSQNRLPLPSLPRPSLLLSLSWCSM